MFIKNFRAGWVDHGTMFSLEGRFPQTLTNLRSNFLFVDNLASLTEEDDIHVFAEVQPLSQPIVIGNKFYCPNIKALRYIPVKELLEMDTTGIFTINYTLKSYNPKWTEKYICDNNDQNEWLINQTCPDFEKTVIAKDKTGEACFRLATSYEFVNIKLLQENVIKKDCTGEWLFNFAKYVEGADIGALQEALLKVDLEGEWLIHFMVIDGCDAGRIQQRVKSFYGGQAKYVTFCNHEALKRHEVDLHVHAVINTDPGDPDDPSKSGFHYPNFTEQVEDILNAHDNVVYADVNLLKLKKGKNDTAPPELSFAELDAKLDAEVDAEAKINEEYDKLFRTKKKEVLEPDEDEVDEDAIIEDATEALISLKIPKAKIKPLLNKVLRNLEDRKVELSVEKIVSEALKILE